MKLENVDLVMGWDIGDGDTVAYARNVSGSKEIFPLYIHKSRSEQVVKSAVSKQSNGTILIGNDAATQQNFVINFKRSPEKWDTQSEHNIAYKQHMSDFIRGVSNAILNNSSNRTKLGSVISVDEKAGVCWKSDKVLLVVGCPAAKIWKGEKNRKKYEALISAATGINNVIVVEESRAAIFSLFALNELSAKINLQQGILVLDFGSSTADATCIIPSKKAIHLSWELGAATIEQAMLQYILDSEKAKKELIKQAKANDRKQVLIDKEQCSHAIFQLRGDKEDYYDGKRDQNTVSDQVRLYMIDENGDVIVEDGEPVPLTIMYKITPEMMQYAVSEYNFETRKDNIVVSTGSWEQNCKNFMLATKLLLEKNKIAPRSVVVTGGGSCMPFVVELAEDVFNKDKIIPSEAPSHSVVRGLATIAYNSLKEEKARKNTVKEIMSDGRKNVSDMMDSISQKLAGKAYDRAVEKLEWMIDVIHKKHPKMPEAVINLNCYWNVGDITYQIQNAIQSSLKNNVTNVTNEEIANWTSNDQKMIVERINQAVSELYSDTALQSMVKISMADVQKITQAINLPNVSIPDVGKDANILGKVVANILTVVLIVILAFIAAAVPVIGPTFVAVVGLFSWNALLEWLGKHDKFPVPLGSIKGAIKKMKNEKSTKIREIEDPLRKAIRDAFTKDSAYGGDFVKYYMVLEESANKAIDRILLITEDNE